MPYTEILKQNLSDAAVHNVQTWLDQPKYAEYRDDVIELIETGNWKQLEDSFFKVIEFGTGGIRGTTGVGSNRINRVTIGEAAQALCQYAAEANPEAAKMGIAIACDTRLSSPELSRYAAQVCAANGFKVYVFDDFRSTPELSFAVRHLGCAAGIVISASHNPSADNGFKAYWSDGGQLVAPHDKGVMQKAAAVTEIKTTNFDQAVQQKNIEYIGIQIDQAYVAAAASQAEGTERDLAIVYSPLHGAGQTNTLPVLKAVGFTQISTVTDQMVPDGRFPTIESGKPNPEEPGANDRAVAQLLEERADIAITNDPDADRVAVMVRQGDDVIYLNGNQSAVLATDYALRKKQQKNELTPNHYVAKTIVTTDMIGALTDHYGVKLYTNMLVGFKYIGDLIRQKEGSGEIFVLGGEESYGLLKGDYARDKDGATGALPLAEYAAELKKEGKTLFDRLLELYTQHGLYLERLDSAYFLGATGFTRMQQVMSELRTTPPKEVSGQIITAVRDYQTLERRDTTTGQVEPIDCNKGNVIVLEFNNDYRCRVTVRPSGTEPKIKLYIQWYQDVSADKKDIQARYQKLEETLESLARTIEGMLLDD